MEKSNPNGPAEELRAAATLIRETESRTLGNGRPWRHAPGRPSDSVRTESGYEIAYGDDPNSLRWIVLMSPDKAETLADWLDAEADTWPTTPAHTSTEPAARRRRSALALAHAILGMSSHGSEAGR